MPAGKAFFFAALVAHASATKRGLIGVDNAHSFGDQPTLMAGTQLSWAMNYGVGPGNASWFAGLEYVPQLWGGNDAASFMDEVLKQDPLPKHILTFNEPDGFGGGQATMTPAKAAELWQKYVEPLKQHNMSLGSPACTGSNGGIIWLEQFLGNCSSSTCTVDFITTHWYGDYQGLADHLGHLNSVANGTKKIWVTELGIAHTTLQATESMYNSSIAWLDSLSWVDRYAWFGAFRSIESNLGPNATMLDAQGQLTQLGRQYLNSPPASGTTSSTIMATATTRTIASASSTARASAGDSLFSYQGFWVVVLGAGAVHLL
ncbi:glycosyl hydrolase catalytic core-domain-containing protein [Protomyces lactucae-debilis]|uniref:Glycosyl hydrolase catalytic core-domain-containing protein n=1 Tax=Protomyces lactucae-debilis TaxID=2754530 RepID=A0A1Y2FC53_PROLT|nr:glycosyl hydrolase catalytic core-domain-containing protein [Protomyces lactucae-debilis]ORY81481.1 glycosyl hydrolase catalytic core-domain-containing protein [Protomyces lactucae-debilis]